MCLPFVSNFCFCFFREIPWQMLNSYSSFRCKLPLLLILPSVLIRGKCFCFYFCLYLFPCLCFCLFREIPCHSVANLMLNSVAHGSGSKRQLTSIIFVCKTRVGSCKFNCHSPLLQKSIMLGLAND
jgi:hypothetical protein